MHGKKKFVAESDRVCIFRKESPAEDMQRFPSIKKNAEYQAVYRGGRSMATGRIVMYVMENGRDHNRLGISVSKKIGNSVVRHTFCRKIREIFRLKKDRTRTGFDIIIIARNPARDALYECLDRDYEKLLKRHGMMLLPQETAETGDASVRNEELK